MPLKIPKVAFYSVAMLCYANNKMLQQNDRLRTTVSGKEKFPSKIITQMFKWEFIDKLLSVFNQVPSVEVEHFPESNILT